MEGNNPATAEDLFAAWLTASANATPAQHVPSEASGPSPASVEQENGVNAPTLPPPNSIKKRKRAWSKEERAEHAVVEKRRREDHNQKLLTLARQLPTMCGAKRINKGNVVQAALSHVENERGVIMSALPDVQRLIDERDAILRELNALRARTGLVNVAKTVDETINIRPLQLIANQTLPTFDEPVFGPGDTGESAAGISTATAPNQAPRPVAPAARQSLPPPSPAPSTQQWNFDPNIWFPVQTDFSALSANYQHPFHAPSPLSSYFISQHQFDNSHTQRQTTFEVT